MFPRIVGGTIAVAAWTVVSTATLRADVEKPDRAVQDVVAGKAVPARTVNDLVAGVRRWVVSIEVERTKDLPLPPKARVATHGPREARDYFKRPAAPVTGLLVDRHGHVLTSFYNVAGTVKSIRVHLDDGRTRKAKVLARAEPDDLALLALERDEELFSEAAWTGPPWAKATPKTGAFLLAIGRAPDPSRVTVTDGIISALGRNGRRTLQTDAKLNYGNVGGPLIDLDGQVVAVSGFVGHTKVDWGMNSGIGFGTTVETIRSALPGLLAGKNVEPPIRPFLGIQSDEFNADIAGAPVMEVVPGSSAASAGVKKGDVIVEFDGRSVDNFNQLKILIYTRRVGEKVTFKVHRGGKTLSLQGTLGKFPSAAP